MRLPYYEPPRLEAVDHVGHGARRDLQRLADFAHGLVRVFEGAHELVRREREAGFAQRGVRARADATGGEQDGVHDVVAGLGFHRRSTSSEFLCWPERPGNI